MRGLLIVCPLCLTHLLLCLYGNKKEKVQYWLAFVHKDTCWLPVTSSCPLEYYQHLQDFLWNYPPCLEAVRGRPPAEKTQGLKFWETSFTLVNSWASSGWMLTQVASHVLLQGGEEQLSTNTSRPLKLPDWKDRFRVNPTQLTLQSPPGQAKLPSACTPPPVHHLVSQISHREDAAT